MSKSEEIDRQVGSLRQIVSKIAALIVSFPVVPDHGSGRVTTFLDGPNFLQAVDKIKPVAVYLDVQCFQASETIAERLRHYIDESDDYDIEGGDVDFSRTPEYKALIKRWSSREGMITRFTASFFIGIVEHKWSEVADWVDGFEENVEQAASICIESERERINNARVAQEGDIKEKAEIVAAHRLFSAPKSSKAKREFLAGQIFPELSSGYIEAIVELADLLSWYRGGTLKS